MPIRELLNPKPETRKMPIRELLNPKPETRNPKDAYKRALALSDALEQEGETLQVLHVAKKHYM